MKKIYQILIILTSGLLLNSCYYDADPVYEDIDDGRTSPKEVSYTTDIIPIWNQCVGCHSGQTPPDMRDDSSHNSFTALMDGYIVAGDADASILYKSLIQADGVSLMPPGTPWPAAKINLVKDWINQGAKNN